jgi:hypothetical protein
MTYPTATEVMEQALRDELTRLLGFCTELQQTAFHEWFPNYPHETTERLSIAYDLVVRTLMENERKRQETT